MRSASTMFVFVAVIVFASSYVTHGAQLEANEQGQGPFNATVNWTFTLPTPQLVMNPVITTPTAAGLPTMLALVPTNTTLFVFEATTGVLAWAFAVPTGDTGGYVTFDAERVYLGTQLSVFALNRADGTVAWRLPLPIPSDGPHASRHARVDVGDDATGNLYITTFNTPLLVVDATTGILRWTGEEKYVSSDHVHVVGGVALYLGTTRSTTTGGDSVNAVVAVTLAGAPMWAIPGVENFEVANLGATAEDTPLLVMRFSHATSQVIQVANLSESATGRLPSPMWNRTIEGLKATFDYVVTDRGTVATATSPKNDAYPNYLTSFALADGKQQWTRTIGFFYLLAGSGAVFAFGTVTHTKAYDAVTGVELWEYDGIGVNDGGARNGMVVFGSAHHIVALNVGRS